MAWCEFAPRGLCVWLPRNQRLRRKIAGAMREAKREHQRDRKASAGVHRVLLPNTKKLEPVTGRGGQGRTIEGRKSALRGHVAWEIGVGWRKPVRTTLLRAGRDGEIASRNSLSLFSDRLSTGRCAQPASSVLSSLAYILLRAAAAHRTWRNPSGPAQVERSGCGC